MKKLLKSYQNAIDQINQLVGFMPAIESNVKQPRTNPFSGKTHNLELQAAVLYDYIVCPVERMPGGFKQQQWDNARYAFLTLWPNEYYDLLD